ncbi:MAG: hypothetical protein HUU20_09010 [Pirellulales bacterium]|nr:hypothetical protein [Pirellulales bacterium]
MSLVVCVAVLLTVPVESQAAMEGVEFIKPQGPCRAYAVALPDGRLMTWWTEGKSENDPAAINNPDIPQKAFARYTTELSPQTGEK